ncbi:CBS domain-containing protein [Hellea sp.]|nr:CBS domain-containing protein [Hellea sp.]
MTIWDLIDDGLCATMTCRPTDFLDETLDQMMDAGISEIAVKDYDGDIAGIVTDYDIMRATNEKGTTGHGISGERVHDWMTEDVIFCETNTTLEQAIGIMKNAGIHHLVIKDGHLLIGVIKLTDALTKLHVQDMQRVSTLRHQVMLANSDMRVSSSPSL